jgi:hypothetical protein
VGNQAERLAGPGAWRYDLRAAENGHENWRKTVPDEYDPLNYDNLARSVVVALMKNAPVPLPPPVPFNGQGVYAIFYSGKFRPYSQISSERYDTPIYVGKAVPKGARKGRLEIEPSSGRYLCRRLADHAKSIEQAENLRLDDFRCRYLVVREVWVTLAEQFLIERFHPLWNKVLDGFGNHPVGKGRGAGRRSRWDIMHPGRPWTKELRAEETPEELAALIQQAQKRQQEPAVE